MHNFKRGLEEKALKNARLSIGVQTLNLQDLFGGKVFKIPNYQRGYSWELEQLNDLISDLELVTDKRHYTGTIVIKKTKEQINAYGESFDRYEIVDGQQRITTLVLFLNEIARELKALASTDKTAEDILRIFVKKEGEQGAVYKIELDEHNDPFFKEKIIENRFSESKTKSHSRLQYAKEFIAKYLGDKRKALPEEKYRQFLLELKDKITRRIGFTLYEVETDSEVGIIFESLNDRGKPLSKLEIVKNYLIYEVEKISKDEHSTSQLVSQINYSWRDILENLSKAEMTDNEDENDFLRMNYILNYYDAISDYKNIDGKRISIDSQLAETPKLVKTRFKEIEKKSKDQCYREIEEYVHALKSMSFAVHDLKNPLGEIAFQNFTDKQKQELALIVDRFSRLEIQANLLPVLIAVYEKYRSNHEQLASLLKICEVAAFRIFYIAGYRSYSGKTKLFTLANEIYTNQLDYDQTIDKLKTMINEYSPNEKIEENLRNISDFYYWAGLTYFLYEYERKRCIEVSPEKTPHFAWTDLDGMKKEESIEHILPQTIIGEDGRKREYWTQRFDEKTHETNCKRLGNLTLSYMNSRLGNRGFDEKQKSYKDSVWQIQRDLASYVEWNENSISEREEKLLNFAKERWGDSALV